MLTKQPTPLAAIIHFNQIEFQDSHLNYQYDLQLQLLIYPIFLTFQKYFKYTSKILFDRDQHANCRLLILQVSNIYYH